MNAYISEEVLKKLKIVMKFFHTMIHKLGKAADHKNKIFIDSNQS
jgi:hypothetical protein